MPKEKGMLTRQDTPFSKGILIEELLSHFQPPLKIKKYTGALDPEDHLCRFQNVSLLHQYNDGVKYRVSLTTLEGLAK